MLEINLEKAKKEISKRKPKTVLVQIPEGLKQHATKIAKELSSKQTEVFVLMEPNFGSCDLPLEKMGSLGADLLIHLGHAPIFKPKNVVFIPIFDQVSEKNYNSLINKLEKELNKKKFKKIGLCTHTQFLYLLEKTKKELEKRGFKVLIKKGSNRTAFSGQVLGCNYTAITSIEPLIDAAVYIGEGRFHPLGLAFSTKKPVLFADASRKKVIDFSKERELFERKRFAAIALAKNASSFGIIVSTKTGQRYLSIAKKCKKLIEENNKKAFLFSMDLVKEEFLVGVNVDCFVNTACPRLACEDAVHWRKPIINPSELEIVFGKKKWEDFSFEALK